MAENALKQADLNRKGSFFKLIDTFASELGELERELAQTSSYHKESMVLHGLEGEVSGVYLQSPACEVSLRERDSGYDSLRRRVTVLDRLTQAHPVWLLLSLSDQEVTRILLKQPPGAFLVRRSSKLQKKVLSVRGDDASGCPIFDFPVRENQYTFSLEGSGLSFADLFRLVAFYCISRDVLPFTLKLPAAIASAKTHTEVEEVAQLGAGFWDCTPRQASANAPLQGRPADLLPHGAASQNHGSPPRICKSSTLPGCLRIQSSRALCFVNPLFLQTHHQVQQDVPVCSGSSPDDSPQGIPSKTGGKPCAVPPPRPPPPRCLPHKPATSSMQGSMPQTSASWCAVQQLHQSVEKTSMGLKHSSPKKPPPPKKPNVDSYHCHIALDEETIAKALSNAKLPHGGVGKVVPSPGNLPALSHDQSRREHLEQRLSDISISTSSSDSLDLQTSDEFHRPFPAHQPGDSSEEEEEDEDLDDDYELDEDDYGVGLENDLQLRLRSPCRCKKLKLGASSALFILPRALKGPFQKVSGVFSSLAAPERRAVRKVVELANDKASYFGCLVQDYVSFLQENGGGGGGLHTSGLDLLQTLRQFLTQMKAYLLHSSDLQPPVESLIPEDQIDQVLEKAMHKCVLKPLKLTVDTALHDFQVRSGAWQQLKENLALAKTKRPQDLGVEGAVPPDAAAIDKIRHKFRSMRKMYSPEKKVLLLLRVCKLIYAVMQDNSGRMFGADDFLPVLTYVLAQCDMPQLDTDIQYMMELLEPSLLNGEGGYYLTSVYGAMSLIKNFQEEQAARILSSEVRNTLHQWHRRRTTERSVPSVEDFQNYLRVALQEVDNGCTAKTLLVRPYATTEEVCQLCAQKFRIADPENYALFLLTGETSQQLAPDTHPQRIKAELHSRPHGQPFNFVYRRVVNLNLGLHTDGQNYR
ncbi:ras and Rab interactor 2 isoform X1 [Denticeps clupeoides]|uniref:Ras and Rab interactor 2 n=2 Tax=Denticeps clupeoides TaxID=299321 RepID=A0AAY4EXU0_9TELE|nr:ras and Rab interactor 2 isoform X1 [Denticeps clupeoides]XP_028829736.1 ras and Rab interactor 2 isoform X1 [Denticeps clupeoides]XP_028829738.1 ras and Rab interactor 2 isoform X1 [Denticeps clupeoides]